MVTASAVLAESSDINIRGAGLGIFGGIVFTAIVIAVILLARSMNMRIKRLPDNFDEPAPQATENSDPANETGSDRPRTDGA
jgi:hypothetical protein